MDDYEVISLHLFSSAGSCYISFCKFISLQWRQFAECYFKVNTPQIAVAGIKLAAIP